MIEICQKQTMFFLNWYSTFINFKECEKNFSSFWQLDAKFIYKIKYFSLAKNQILYPLLGSLITHTTITFKQDIKQSDRHMISWGKWNTLLHFDYFIPSILMNNFFSIYLLCCIFIYILDFTCSKKLLLWSQSFWKFLASSFKFQKLFSESLDNFFSQ